MHTKPCARHQGCDGKQIDVLSQEVGVIFPVKFNVNPLYLLPPKYMAKSTLLANAI